MNLYRKKDKVSQVVDLKFTRNTKGKPKKKRLDDVVYLNSKRFIMRMKEKKMGLSELWI